MVRGAASTGYSYITGKVSPQPLAADNAATRAQAVRHVSIDITNDVLVVTIAYGQNSTPVQVIGPLDLSKISGQPALPSTFKYGFAGFTFQTRTNRITGEGDVGPCESSDLSLTGRTYTFSATGQGECPDGFNGNFQGDITWNNGQASVIEGTAVVSPDRIGMGSITVKRGEFAGDHGSCRFPGTARPACTRGWHWRCRTCATSSTSTTTSGSRACSSTAFWTRRAGS